MPISSTVIDDVLITRMSGTVEAKAFLDFYRPLLIAGAYRSLRGELVDGREIVSWRVPASAQWDLADLAARHVEHLRHLRVAMVASSDHVYGSFRMWELQREDLGYEVRPYRSLPPALLWLRLELPSDSPPR